MRHSGLMVSVLVSGSSGLGLSPGQGHCVETLCCKTLYPELTVPLSTQVYKPVPANLMLGVTLRRPSIPSRREYKHSQSLHATETRISASMMGHLAHTQNLPDVLLNLGSCVTYWCEFEI